MTEGWGALSGSGPQEVHLNTYRTAQSQAGNYSHFRSDVWYQPNTSYGTSSWDNGGYFHWILYTPGATFEGDFSVNSGNRADTQLLATIDFDIGHDSEGYLGSFTTTARINTNHGTIGSGDITVTEGSSPRIPKAPATPSIVSFSNKTPTNIRVTSSQPDNRGSSIDTYGFQFATDSGFTANVGYMENNGYVHDITPLSERTLYYFRVRAHNGVGWSGYSAGATSSTLGHPTAPQTVSAVASASVTGRNTITWSAPASAGEGGITGYNIFRDGTQIATITGTTTSHVDNGRTKFTTYSYTVAARNAYSDSISGVGPQSTASSVVAQGPPTAPQNLTANYDGAVPGKVDLAWQAPATAGNGGITGYKVYYSGGALVVNQSGTGTTYSITGLNPGTTYSFQVFARNALGDTEGTTSPGSNTADVTPIGEPQAPGNFSVLAATTTSNRLVLSWTAPAGTLTGYSIFSRAGGADTLLQKIPANNTSFAVDNVSAGSGPTFVVRARTAYTDTLSNGYPGNWGGASTAAAQANASNNSTQTVPNISGATSGTNAVLNGTYIISNVTSNSISYARTSSNIAYAASGGSVANNTNAVFNGAFSITSTPTISSFTYARVNSNINILSVFGGSITDDTNVSMNVVNVAATAVNAGAQTVSYNKSGTSVAAVSVPVNAPPGNRGTITNLTNANFNVTGKIITAVTSKTLSYSQTGSNISENSAAGTVTDVTNQNVYNGSRLVTAVPAHNVVTYETAANTETAGTRTWLDPRGTVQRGISTAILDVKYRSGWIG